MLDDSTKALRNKAEGKTVAYSRPESHLHKSDNPPYPSPPRKMDPLPSPCCIRDISLTEKIFRDVKSGGDEVFIT